MKKIAAAALLALLAAPSFAGDTYVVGSLGWSKADIDQSSLNNAVVAAGGSNVVSSVDNTDFGYKLQLGYQFNPYVAVEGGYINLGKAKYSASYTGGNLDMNFKSYGWAISAVGILPINDAFSAFGKLGLINAHVSVDGSGNGPLSVASTRTTDGKVTWGLGAAYNINKQFGVRVEYEQFNKLGNKNETGESDVKLISTGVTYKF